MTKPTENTFDESISALIDLAIMEDSKEASVLFSNHKGNDGEYHGWDIKITVGFPGSLE